MPYNSTFRLPLQQAAHQPASSAPYGSLILPVLGASGFVCWRPGGDGEELRKVVVEWTTYTANPLQGTTADEPCLIFDKPTILIDPATAYDPDDKGARGVGDIITNGDTILLSAWTAEQRMLAFKMKAGTSKAPLVGYKGWDIHIEGQHIFTKHP